HRVHPRLALDYLPRSELNRQVGRGLFDAGGGGRTRTDLSVQGILSPLCLPVPPPRRLLVLISKHKVRDVRRGAARPEGGPGGGHGEAGAGLIESGPSMSRLKDKTVLLGVSGGIAAYKAAEIVRLMVRR